MAYNKIITKHDYDFKLTKKFNRHYIMTHSIFMYLIFALGLFSLYQLLTGDGLKEGEEFSYYLSWSIAIIGILFVPVYLILNVHLITKKDAKNKTNFYEINEFTKEKIVKNDNSGEKKIVLNWNLIAKVVEYEDVFYFYTTNDAAFLVPKYAFVEGNALELRSMIFKCLQKDNKGKLPYKIHVKEYKEEQKRLKAEQKKNKKSK